MIPGAKGLKLCEFAHILGLLPQHHIINMCLIKHCINLGIAIYFLLNVCYYTQVFYDYESIIEVIYEDTICFAWLR